MGMFDELRVKCPHCHGATFIQSKAGNCTLATYSPDSAPMSVMSDVVGRHSCDECGQSFGLRVVGKPVLEVEP